MYLALFFDVSMVKRPMESKKSNDADMVPSETYSYIKKGTPFPSKLAQLTPKSVKFNALKSERREGTPILPPRFFSAEMYDELWLFREFFNDAVLERMILCTNLQAQRERQKFHDHDKGLCTMRVWKEVTKEEILSYMGILIWMGLFRTPCRDTYWNTDSGKGPISTAVSDSMSKDRWEQINRYLHVFDQEEDWAKIAKETLDKEKKKIMRYPPRPHNKVEALAALVSAT